MHDGFRVDIPKTIYRRFEKLEHAEAFRSGRMRLMPLVYYRNSEIGNRSDANDGIIIYSIKEIEFEGHRVEMTKGRANFRLTYEENIYINCFSKGYSDDLSRKFGNFIVKISDVDSLIKRIIENLLGKNDKSICYGSVIYRNETDVRIDEYNAWRCKDISYSDEFEFRIGFFINNDYLFKIKKTYDSIDMDRSQLLRESITFMIGDISDICSIQEG